MDATRARSLVFLAPTLAAAVGGTALGWVLGFDSGSKSVSPYPYVDLRAPTPELAYDLRANSAPGSVHLAPDAPLGTLTRLRSPLRGDRSEVMTIAAAKSWEEYTTLDENGLVRVRELHILTVPSMMVVVTDARGMLREFGAIQLVPIGSPGGGHALTQIGYRSVRNASGFEDADRSGYYDNGVLQR